MFVAPRTRIPSLLVPTPERRRTFLRLYKQSTHSQLRFFRLYLSPCIWTRNSVLILRAASLSFSLLEPQRESISSMKMIDGLCSRAKVNKFFTNLERDRGRSNSRFFFFFQFSVFPVLSSCKETGPHFSLSPNHLDTRSDEEMEKKVELLASVATALAR